MTDPQCELRKGGWVVRIFIFLVALVASILSSDAVNSCRFLITEPDGNAFGLYAYETTDTVDRVCQSVSFLKDTVEEDIFADESSWKAAQGLGSAGAAIGDLAVLFMFLGFFCNWCAKKWCFKFLLPLMFIAAAVCTVLTNLAYDVDMCKDVTVAGVKTKQACTAGPGTNAASGAFILYLIAGLSMLFCMTPWERPMYKFVDELSNDDDAPEQVGEKPAEPTEGMVEPVVEQEAV